MPTFRRRSRTRPDIPTASMPDIIFILLIFFMVSTVLRETTVQVRPVLPEAEALTRIDQKRLVAHLWIGPPLVGGRDTTLIQVDDALVDNLADLRFLMRRKLAVQPRLIVSLRIDEAIPMETVLAVQQELREAGTLRINYSTKKHNPAL